MPWKTNRRVLEELVLGAVVLKIVSRGEYCLRCRLLFCLSRLFSKGPGRFEGLDCCLEVISQDQLVIMKGLRSRKDPLSKGVNEGDC